MEYKLRLIRHLELRFNLWDSESISNYIQTYKCSNRRKNNILSQCIEFVLLCMAVTMESIDFLQNCKSKDYYYL